MRPRPAPESEQSGLCVHSHGYQRPASGDGCRGPSGPVRRRHVYDGCHVSEYYWRRVRDFYEQLLGKKPSQKFLLRASVITTVITAVIAYVLTLNTTGAIALIGSMSTGLLGASFSVVVVGGLYSKKMTTQAAIAAMLAGFFGTVLTTKGVVLDHLLFGMNAFIYGFIAAIVAAVVVTALTNKDGIDQTISNT